MCEFNLYLTSMNIPIVRTFTNNVFAKVKIKKFVIVMNYNDNNFLFLW